MIETAAASGATTLTVVVDTNILLQGKPLSALPWEQLAEQVDIVLSDPVLTELDRWKGEGSDRRAKRVRAMLPLFRALLAAESLTIDLPHATCRVRLTMRATDTVVSSTDADGAIVEVAHELLSEGRTVLLLTRDVILALRARRRGVPYRLVATEDADWNAKPDAPSADQAELLRKLREYEQQRPEIELTMAGPGVALQAKTLTVTAPKPPKDFIVSPFLHEWTVQQFGDRRGKDRDFGNDSWQDDLSRLEKRFSSAVITRIHRGPVVELVLTNAGSINATDVRVEFIVEGAWRLRSECQSLEIEVPYPPRRVKPSEYGRFDAAYVEPPRLPHIDFTPKRDDDPTWELSEETPLQGTTRLIARVPVLRHRGEVRLQFHIGVQHPATDPGKLVVLVSYAGRPKVDPTTFVLVRDAPQWTTDELVQHWMGNGALVIEVEKER